jgi:hypothetical protein
VSRFIDQNRERLGVEPICRELEVSASAYRPAHEATVVPLAA